VAVAEKPIEAVAKLNYARISPRKVKIVLDLIRGEEVKTARSILRYTPKAASEYLIKLLDSAVANGENNFSMNRDELYVAQCYVCQGPTLKRIRPMDHGKAYRINKKTSHITIVLREKE
jgi:large subunit ribosomal protein L22